MSTRSLIAMQIEEDKYRTIYCHSDGYLTYNGAMLLDYYNTPEKVKELIDLGSISYLAKKLNPDPLKPVNFYCSYLYSQGTNDCLPELIDRSIKSNIKNLEDKMCNLPNLPKRYNLNRINQINTTNIALASTRIFARLTQAFRNDFDYEDEQIVPSVDKKLVQEINEKKQAQGLKM